MAPVKKVKAAQFKAQLFLNYSVLYNLIYLSCLEISEGSFFKHFPKTGGDSGADLLRPQRKSFVSGCQMRTNNSESNLEKQAEVVGGGKQERNRDRNSGGENGKDRYQIIFIINCFTLLP